MIVENIKPAAIVSTVLQPGRRTKVTPELGKKLIRTGNFREVSGNTPTQDDVAVRRFTADPGEGPAMPPKTKKKTKSKSK